jgi:hypothetical protein
MGSESSVQQLLDVSSAFVENLDDLAGLQLPPDRADQLLSYLTEFLSHRGVAQAVRPVPVDRLRSPGHRGYPLRRTLLVMLNRERHQVTAEFKEVFPTLSIRGIGGDEQSALRDLERQFDQLVREKVRIPPHALMASDEPIRAIVNHLVDWDQFDRENPSPALIWGRVVRHESSGRPTVHWLIGPGGIRNKTALLPRKYRTPYFNLLKPGEWFRGIIREYPDQIVWDEPPKQCQDPTDEQCRQAAWDAIPRVAADEPDVWPLKRQ